MPTALHHITRRHPSLHSFRYYDLLVHAFVVVLLISNLVAQKFIQFPTISFLGFSFTPAISAAQALFPLTYIFGDIFTEVYGYAGSRRAIWIGFFASAFMALVGAFVVWLPPAPGFQHQAAFETIFYQLPRTVAASLIAFWAGEFANSYVLAKMKVLTAGRHLWMRTIGSTAVGQAVDTVVVVVIIFAFTVPWNVLGTLIISGYLGKVIYEAAATPLTYLVVNGLKRAEGVDVYDVNTDFNPFRAGAEQAAEERAAQ